MPSPAAPASSDVTSPHDWTVVAQLTEWTMVVPLLAKAQAQILAEGVSEAAPPAPEPPLALRPSHPFSEESIRAALPAGRFTLHDLRRPRR